jgi:hypothetical protein
MFGIIFLGHSRPLTVDQFQQADATHWVLDVASLAPNYAELKEVRGISYGLTRTCAWAHGPCARSSAGVPFRHGWAAQVALFLLPTTVLDGSLALGLYVRTAACNGEWG